MQYEELLAPVRTFLQCATPTAWLEHAAKPENLPVILKDHLVCELKAAQTAMLLIRKYAADRASGETLLQWLKPYEDFIFAKEGTLADLAAQIKLKKSVISKSETPYGQDLIDKMVLLIREELHHFYQVYEIMEARGIEYDGVTASRYAKRLLSHVRTHEPHTLIEKLICGAYIEARSCERFAMLAPYVDDELRNFYYSLLRSEARHYEDYLALAREIAGYDISDRIAYFGQIEAQLIETPDEDFKFHSGVPVLNHQIASLSG